MKFLFAAAMIGAITISNDPVITPDYWLIGF